MSDDQRNMMAFANEWCDEIFCIGYDEALDPGEVAQRYHQQHFSIVDGVVDAPTGRSAFAKGRFRFSPARSPR